MKNEILIKFSNEYKSFKQDSEYNLEGQLIIISGINGSGKSQFLEGIYQENATVYINNKRIQKKTIEKYSFKDNILPTSFGTYNLDIVKQTDNLIIGIYNRYNSLHKQYISAKENFGEEFERQLGIEKATSEEKYCLDRIDYNIGFSDQRNGPTVQKEIAKSTILQIIQYIKNNNTDPTDLENDKVFSSIPSDFIPKFEKDEVNSITRIFTEAARLKFQERNKYADVKQIFDNNNWLKTAPWTELNNLFEKLHFNYRFQKDFDYTIPSLREEPMLYVYENEEINKRKDRNINDLSDGEKAILKLAVATYDRKKDNATKLLLLDEYDATLNPSLIKDYYTVIEEYYLKKGITVILTTHSPATISLAPESAIFYEIFREENKSPNILKVAADEYKELKIIEKYYDKVKDSHARQNMLEKNLKELQEKIDNIRKSLILTEGKTDWKHLKFAKNILKDVSEYDFFEYLEDMGDINLLQAVKSYAKIGGNNKKIFIFDNDNDKISKEVTDPSKKYKNWGNNVYTFTIPKPGIREDEEKISIEHYFTDDILKKEVIFPDGTKRRLYCGNDFQETGLNTTINKRCNKKDCCGEEKIHVLSGCGEEKVFDLDKKDIDSANYALTKDAFFEKVISENKNSIDFQPFKLIFEIIAEILDLES